MQEGAKNQLDKRFIVDVNNIEGRINCKNIIHNNYCKQT